MPRTKIRPVEAVQCRVGIGALLALGGAVAVGLAAIADPQAPADTRSEFAVSMALTETEHGDAVVSLQELTTNERIPKQARRLYESALKSERQGQQGQALEQMRAAVEMAPDFFQAHAALAAGYLNAGKIDEAEQHIEVSLKLNPYYLPAYEIRGLALFFRGKFREAADTLGSVVKNAPYGETAHYFLGLALLRAGDQARASYHMRMAETLLRQPARPRPDASDSWSDSAFTAPSFRGVRMDPVEPRHVRRPGPSESTPP